MQTSSPDVTQDENELDLTRPQSEAYKAALDQK